MTVSTFFLVHTIERLATVFPVTYRRIFNGYGVYHQGIQFAILVNDQLYFRTDEESRHCYEEEQLLPFSSRAMVTLCSDFYRIPPAILNRQDALTRWMTLAIDSAQRSCAMEGDEAWDQMPRVYRQC